MSCPISKKATPKLRKRWPHCKEDSMDKEVRFYSEGTSVAGVVGFPQDINSWT